MKETKLNKAERMPEKEVQALIRRSGAEALVQFLNFDFARHGKTIKDVERYLEPRPRQYLYGDLLRFRIIKPARLRLAADYQKKLRTLLVPIFSARFAKSPVVDLEQKLVNE